MSEIIVQNKNELEKLKNDPDKVLGMKVQNLLDLEHMVYMILMIE